MIEANGHNLSVVFSDLSVDYVEPGYSPFIVVEDATLEHHDIGM